MFSDSPSAQVNADTAIEQRDEMANVDRLDGHDDAEGYYAMRIGEVLHDKYRILGGYGRGVFSTVVRCEDIPESQSGRMKEVAIKVKSISFVCDS